MKWQNMGQKKRQYKKMVKRMKTSKGYVLLCLFNNRLYGRQTRLMIDNMGVVC